MYAKEMLVSSSPFAERNGVKGILTSAEALARAKRTKTVVVISSFEEKKFFFSDDHCFGVRVLPEHWVPSTSVFPMSVKPRPGLEDGIIDTIEKYISVFEKGREQINSIDELIDVLNKGETNEENFPRPDA